MKIIKYRFCVEHENERGVLTPSYFEKEIICDDSSVDEILITAETEAVNGEYIVSDITSDISIHPSTSERIEALETAMLEIIGVDIND